MPKVPVTLPPMALAHHAVTRLADLTRDANGLWLRAIDGTNAGWPAHVGDITAEPKAIEPELSRFAPYRGRMALHLTAGANGGFEAPSAAPDPGLWSAAIIWTSGAEEARSLLTVRGGGDANYVFLAETEDRQIVFRDDAERAVAALPPAGGGWQVSILSCAAGRLSLARPDGAEAEAAGVTDLATDGRLLIGCRNHRPGMKKTLGSAIISEVLFWPGLDILSRRPAPLAIALRDALDTFILWEL